MIIHSTMIEYIVLNYSDNIPYSILLFLLASQIEKYIIDMIYAQGFLEVFAFFWGGGGIWYIWGGGSTLEDHYLHINGIIFLGEVANWGGGGRLPQNRPPGSPDANLFLNKFAIIHKKNYENSFNRKCLGTGRTCTKPFGVLDSYY